MRSSAALVALALLASTSAHSWVEMLTLIDPATGLFTGTPGYSRNNTKRGPGFTDPLMVHILPPMGQPAIEERDIPASDTVGISNSDPMCKHTQQTQYQSDGSPRLKAYPGSLVALRYQENGHVSLPQNQKGKPPNRGTVRIYGTTQPKSPELFQDVFGQWRETGDGGDKRGKLLATQPFDDGRCYQVNSGDISKSRQGQYSHTANDLMGADLWCQNNLAIPTDIAVGTTLTLYWTWDWPTLAGVDPSLPNGKAEIYTTCMDVDIVAKPAGKRRVKARQAPSAPSPSPASANLNNAAIPAYVSSLTASPAPAGASPAISAQAPATSPQALTTSAKSEPSKPAAQVADSNPMTNAGVVSYIENAVSAAIAQIPKVPLTVTVAVVESAVPPGAVAATPPAATPPAATPASNPAVPAASNSPPAVNPAAVQAPVSNPPTASTSTPAQAPAPSSMPPKSLEINPPMLSGTATPVAISPVPAANSAVAAGASQSTPVIIASGATQNGTAAAAKAQRGCNAKTCKSKRQSRIFGKKD